MVCLVFRSHSWIHLGLSTAQGSFLRGSTQMVARNPCVRSRNSPKTAPMGHYVNFQVYNNNINDPKDYGGEDICNHCGIEEKNKTLLLFFLLLSVVILLGTK